MAKDDRTTRQPARPHLSDSGLGDDLRSFLTDPFPVKPPRQRNLRPTFRPVPGQSSTDFPGTRAFSPRGPHRGPNGSDIQPESLWAGFSSAASKGSDDFKRRRPALLEAGRPASPLGPAIPAAEGPGGGNVRRRPGRPPGSKTKIKASGAESAKEPIMQPLPTGARVVITDPGHPWTGLAGAVVSAVEIYGLGWFGQRVQLDGNAGDTYVRPEQTDWKRKPGRPPADKPLPLPAAIQKLVPKSDEPKSPPKMIPTETERADARRLFREIGQRFNENRKKSKTAAYAGYRHDLMDNLDTLVMGGAIDLKEATTIVTSLEQFTRETEAESTETPATILGRWLRMDVAEVAGLVPVEEVVEDEENSGEEIDELDAAI